MLMDEFAPTEINSGPLTIAANEIVTTTIAAETIKGAVLRPRNLAVEEAILWNRYYGV